MLRWLRRWLFGEVHVEIHRTEDASNSPDSFVVYAHKRKS